MHSTEPSAGRSARYAPTRREAKCPLRGVERALGKETETAQAQQCGARLRLGPGAERVRKSNTLP